jgi:hypothetical protein
VAGIVNIDRRHFNIQFTCIHKIIISDEIGKIKTPTLEKARNRWDILASWHAFRRASGGDLEKNDLTGGKERNMGLPDASLVESFRGLTKKL